MLGERTGVVRARPDGVLGSHAERFAIVAADDAELLHVAGTGRPDAIRYDGCRPPVVQRCRVELAPAEFSVGVAGEEAPYYHDDCEAPFGGVPGSAVPPGSVWTAWSVASTVARATCWSRVGFVNSIPLS